MSRQLSISEAVEKYLDSRKREVSDSTLYNHSSQLKQFIEWCDQNDRPELVNDLDIWDIADFKEDRWDEEIENITLRNQMTVLRVFLRWCESRDLLEGVSENINMPKVDNESRETTLDREDGERLLKQLQKYEYASLEHTLFAVLWTTGIRVGTARSLDVSDFDSDEMYLETNHRPDKGTPLKNGVAAERHVNLHEWVCVVIDDYLDGRRHNVTDDHGRSPVFTTTKGRAHRNTLRKKIRAITRPCEYENTCPLDRSIETCDATSYNQASKCPGSVSPHPLRRSAITNWLDDGHSKELVSDRMDVSVDVLEKHYDARTDKQKRELRREMFEMD